MILADYTRSVLADFEKKKAAGLLPAELLEPSPGLLRDLCYRLCQKPYSRKDEQILERFFGVAIDQKARLRSIAGIEITKFKPLINFLNNPAIKPKLKTVDLLAWLIDFKGRPYDLHGRLPAGEQDGAVDIDLFVRAVDGERSEVAADEPEGAFETGLVPTKSGDSRNKKIKIVVTISIVLAASIGFFSIWTRKNSPYFPPIPPGTQACMFWADDHYQAVRCDQKLGDTLVVALDSEKLLHFRKITRPDTITQDAIGHVWYVRFRGTYEFYTDTGYHPIDPELRLRKLSPAIVMRHIVRD